MEKTNDPFFSENLSTMARQLYLYNTFHTLIQSALQSTVNTVKAKDFLIKKCKSTDEIQKMKDLKSKLVQFKSCEIER